VKEGEGPSRHGRSGEESAARPCSKPLPRPTMPWWRSIWKPGTLTTKRRRRGLVEGCATASRRAGAGGCARVCVGIQPLLDFIVDCFPAPTDRPPWKGKIGEDRPSRGADPAAPVAAYVWKTCTSDIGRLSLMR